MNKFVICKFENKYSKVLKDFNSRIASTNNHFPDPSNWQFYENKSPITQEFYILLEDDTYIRAISAIKNQNYQLNDTLINFQDIQLPVSESLIDVRFISQTIYFLKYISNLGSNMHALGMGGISTPLPKILIKNKFSSHLIPFFIFPISLTSFFELALFNKFKIKLNRLFFSPLIVIDFVRIFFLKKMYEMKNVNIEPFFDFDSSFSTLWEKLKSNFQLIAVKDAINLNRLYQNSPHDLIKYKIFIKNQYLGYIILKITKHQNNKYFQNFKTITIVDLLCENAYYSRFIKIIKNIALKNNCDLILVNSSFDKFNISLSKAMFLNLPSNFGFVYKTESNFNILNSWITRADGDGPINV